MQLKSVQTKILLPILACGLALTALCVALMFGLKARSVETTGLNTAKAVSSQVITLRKVYTAEIAARAKQSGMEINYDFAQRQNTLPLPATMVKFLGDQLAANHPGTRAGAHGLGFAVVADEVRKLAERSARSTKEISEIVAAIQRESRAAVQQMEASNQVVCEYINDLSVSEALQAIIAAVEKTVELTCEIEAATSEQSAGAEQIGRATQDLARLTQTISSATVVQATNAGVITQAMERMREAVCVSNHLEEAAGQFYLQADALQNVVGKFQVEQTKPSPTVTHGLNGGARSSLVSAWG